MYNYSGPLITCESQAKATDGIFYDKALFSASYPQPHIAKFTIVASVTMFLHLKGLGWDNAKLHCLCMRSEAMQFHMLMCTYVE